MIPWYGYRPASSTVYMYFHSFAAATGASSATSNFAAGDILIYKDGSDVQRTSANGITVTTSFDGQTGLQVIAIDLSDNTHGGFYAAGSHYGVAAADVTIDTQTVRFWVGSFDIGPAQVNVTQFGSSAGTFASGIPEVKVASIANNAITANSIASDAITDAKVASDVTIASVTGAVGSVTGAVGSVTGNVSGNVTGSVGSIATGGIAAASFAASAIDATALAANAATEIADAILTRQITEAYAANGVAPTTAQALMAIHQALMQFAIASTTKTVKKLDNSTTAFLITHDSDTAPTSAART